MRVKSHFIFALLLPGSLCLPLAAVDGQASASANPHGATPVAVTQTASAPTPDSQPPTVPQVSYHDGLLTIHAANSTLGDILRAVERVTGATIDSPGYASERVYATLGPGAPRDVLASLLNGSRYDYVLLGVPQQPEAVSRVMLTLRQNFTEQPAPAPVNQAAANADSDDSPDDSPPDREPVPEPKPEQAPPPVPGAAGSGHPGPGQPTSPQSGQPQVKTPDQLLQELQQMRQQQPGGATSPSQ